MRLKEFSSNISFRSVLLLQFIDLCILLGCDYCESIRGIGPKRAIELIAQHKSIEEVLKNIDTKKYIVPENWNFEQARKLFVEPVVADPATIDVGFDKFYSTLSDFMKIFLDFKELFPISGNLHVQYDFHVILP